jgi:hypothetical protein
MATGLADARLSNREPLDSFCAELIEIFWSIRQFRESASHVPLTATQWCHPGITPQFCGTAYPVRFFGTSRRKPRCERPYAGIWKMAAPCFSTEGG